MHGGCVKWFLCIEFNNAKKKHREKKTKKNKHPHETNSRVWGLKLRLGSWVSYISERKSVYSFISSNRIPRKTTDILSEETCFSSGVSVEKLEKVSRFGDVPNRIRVWYIYQAFM